MGQYYIVANLDKKEYLNPHKCNDGKKLMEIAFSGGGTMGCLTLLCAGPSNGKGGGDFGYKSEFSGRWAGDRIAIIGDYDDSETYGPIYKEARAGENGWKEIGEEVYKVISKA
jgi:hypothetical protein